MISKRILILFGVSVMIISCIVLLWFPVIQIILILHLSHIPSRPVITIESDDWGGLRGLDWNSNPRNWSRWSNLDCLESTEDVKRLSTMLQQHRDSRGRPAVFTANVVLESIAGDRVNNKIIRRQVPQDIIRSWKEVMADHTFFPQLHAMREADEYSTLDPNASVRKKTSPYMVWNGERFVDLPTKRVEKVVLEGQEMFKRIFGFKSLSTIPPRYLWGDATDLAFAKAGIKYVQRLRPLHKRTPHFLSHDQVVGEHTHYGLMILASQVDFEPVYNKWNNGKPREDWSLNQYLDRQIRKTIRKINRYEPVAISSHRINYVSGHNLSQAKYGLMALDRFLSALLEHIPDLVILTSPELGEYLERGYFTDVFTGEKVTIPRVTLWRLIRSHWRHLRCPRFFMLPGRADDASGNTGSRKFSEFGD